MKIAVIGYNGKVAEAVRYYLKKEIGDIDLLVLTMSENIRTEKVLSLNILDKKILKKELYAFAPSIIVNTVAMTDVDGCQVDKKLARDLNTTLVENLTDISKVLDAHLITFSTDFIFNGKKGLYSEDDKPEPLSYYGITKLAAENYLVANHNKYTIFRTNLVFGYTTNPKPSFIGWLLDSISQNKEINLVESLWGNPTHSIDLAMAVIVAIKKKTFGIYNIAGSTYLNRYELALEVGKFLGKDKNQLDSIIKIKDIKDLKQKAIRPVRGGLSNEKSETELGLRAPTLQESLDIYTKCFNSKSFL